jgi:hypothetical protein
MNNLGVIRTGLPFFELNDYLNTVEREKNDKRKPCKTNRSVQLYLSTPKLFMICLTLFLFLFCFLKINILKNNSKIVFTFISH